MEKNLTNRKFRNFYHNWFIYLYPRYFNTFDEYIASEYSYDKKYKEKFYKEYNIAHDIEYQKHIEIAGAVTLRVIQINDKKIVLAEEEKRDKRWKGMTFDQWWEDITGA